MPKYQKSSRNGYRMVPKKRYKKYRRAYATQRDLGTLARTAYRTAMMTRGLLNVEFKKYDEDVSWTRAEAAYDASDNVICLNDMGQGTSVSTRAGNSILMKSIAVRGLLNTDGSQESSVRLVLFTDQNCNGIVPSMNDLLEDGNSDDSVFSYIDSGYGSRFNVLRSEMIHLLPGTDTKDAIVINWRIKLNLHSKYDGTGNNNVPISGGIFLGIITDRTAAQANGATFEGKARLSFIDN
jgi:hypothetical protein